MLFVNVTGKKESKGYNEPIIVATPTVGDFKITPLAQKTLNIVDGDFIILTTHPDEPNRVFFAKGIKAEALTDEAGNIVKDERGRTSYKEGTGFGAVVRIASKGSSNLKCTGAAAWNAIGGDTALVKDFVLGEPIEGGVPTGNTLPNGEPEIHSTVFFELLFKESKPKARKGEGDGDDEDEDEALTATMSQEAASATEEEEV